MHTVRSTLPGSQEKRSAWLRSSATWRRCGHSHLARTRARPFFDDARSPLQFAAALKRPRARSSINGTLCQLQVPPHQPSQWMSVLRDTPPPIQGRIPPLLARTLGVSVAELMRTRSAQAPPGQAGGRQPIAPPAAGDREARCQREAPGAAADRCLHRARAAAQQGQRWQMNQGPRFKRPLSFQQLSRRTRDRGRFSF